MAEENSVQELEVASGSNRLKIRGSDWLSLLGVAVGVLLIYMVYEHKTDAKDASIQFQTVVKEMVVAQRDMVSAQREQNCLIAFSQEVRERNSEFCKRMARDR